MKNYKYTLVVYKGKKTQSFGYNDLKVLNKFVKVLGESEDFEYEVVKN
jgi:hypothetical protein